MPGDVLPDDLDPLSDQVESAVLEDEEGNEYTVDQQNAGPESEAETDEWPDPDTPPTAPAPGS